MDQTKAGILLQRLAADRAADRRELSHDLIEVAASVPIFGEGSPAKSYYQVEKGLVRIYRLLPNGNRHILLFRGPGEWFGFMPGRIRQEVAEAASDVRLRIYPGRPGQYLPREVLNQVLADIAKAHARQFMLIEKDPVKRLAAFLNECAGAGQTDLNVEIPMSRRDVADYLGLTIETIARCFTKLRRRGIIRLGGRLRRSVEIVDRKALAILSSSF